MKKSECFRLAYINLKTFKKNRTQYFISIFMITFFLMLFFSVCLITKRLYHGMLYDSISTNSMDVYLNLDSNGNLISDEGTDLLHQVSTHKGVTMGPKYAQVNLSASGQECYLVNIDDVTCLIDEKEFQGKNDNSFDFVETKSISKKEDRERFKVYFSIEAMDIGSNLFSENTWKEFQYKYDTDVFICGRRMQREKELVISDYMLKRFGIYDGYDSLLNQEISFYVNNHLVIDHYTIVGIINSDYYRVYSENERSQVIVSGTPDLYSSMNTKVLIQKIGLGDFADGKKMIDVMEDKQEDVCYVSSTIGIFEIIDKFRLICQRMISIFMSIIVVAMMIKLVSNIYINRKKRAYYYGILKAMGMEEREMIEICLYELLFLLFFCMAVSIAFTFLVLKILQYIILETVGYFITISFWELLLSLMLTGGIVSVFILVISVVVNRSLLKKSIVEVINS